MARHEKEERWALSGRESPFQRKLADLRSNEQTVPPRSRKVTKPASREADPLALLRETQASLIQSRPEELEQQALTDNLTGFMNSRQFSKKLDYELKRGMRYKRPVALCMVAIDGLAEVKRIYGAIAADNVLKLAANAISSSIREVDLPARYSNDILAVIFPETNAMGVRTPAERVREMIKSQVITLGGQDVFITGTIAIASFPTHGRQADELIAKASMALELGAQRGGDVVTTV